MGVPAVGESYKVGQLDVMIRSHCYYNKTLVIYEIIRHRDDLPQFHSCGWSKTEHIASGTYPVKDVVCCLVFPLWRQFVFVPSTGSVTWKQFTAASSQAKLYVPVCALHYERDSRVSGWVRPTGPSRIPPLFSPLFWTSARHSPSPGSHKHIHIHIVDTLNC